MNKVVIAVIVVAVLAIAVGTVGYVSAQSPTTQAPFQGRGFGMMGAGNGQGMTLAPAPRAGVGGRGPRAGFGRLANSPDQPGPMHDAMIAAFAKALGLSVDELNTRLDKGETMWQIAASKGLTAEQTRTLMQTARSQALDQAVKDGTLTQAQADWMKQRGPGMMGGRGAGGFGRANCPMFAQGQSNAQGQ